ncbi:excinuclease UvrABC ATPase subunit [Lysinibacillus sp. RC79]
MIRNLFVKQYPESVIFDQSSIQGSNWSNLLSYLGVFEKIRQKYSEISGKNTSLFSFNGKGACPECKGKGVIKYDLAYMGDFM